MEISLLFLDKITIKDYARIKSAAEVCVATPSSRKRRAPFPTEPKKTKNYDTAKMMSLGLCNQKVDQLRESYSYGINGFHDDISLSNQSSVKPLVSSLQIMKLEDFNTYFRSPENASICDASIYYIYRKNLAMDSLKIVSTSVKKYDIKSQT